jgi:hypothetical protein
MVGDWFGEFSKPRFRFGLGRGKFLGFLGNKVAIF